MKKIPKKAKIFVGVAVLVGAVGFGCFRVYQDHFNGTVAVYSASDDSISTSAANWGGSQYDGTIQADGVQTIMVSESQTVGEVAVKEGQQVKKGDKLFSYDTTLSDLDMQRAQLDIKKLELQLKTARNNLKIVQKYRPGEPVKEKITQIDPVESSGSDDSSDKDSGNQATNTNASQATATVVLLGGDRESVKSFDDSDSSGTMTTARQPIPSRKLNRCSTSKRNRFETWIYSCGRQNCSMQRSKRKSRTIPCTVSWMERLHMLEIRAIRARLL